MTNNTHSTEELLRKQVRFLREIGSMQPTQRAKHMPWMAAGNWFTVGLIVGLVLMYLVLTLPGGGW